MPNFTNPYNNQNGMMSNMGQVPAAGYPSSAWQPGGMNPPMATAPTQLAMQNMQTPQPNMQEWKPYSPGPQMSPLIGKWVAKFDDIKPQDVPMDGSMCFFPQSDGSCIYAMMWSNDGKIVPYRFLPEKNEAQASQSQQSPNINDLINGFEMMSSNLSDGYEKMGSAISNRLESFEKRLDEILNSQSLPTPRVSRRKTDKEDEAV